MQYGPFRIDGDAGEDEVLRLDAGARVVFTSNSGKVTIATPSFDK